MKISIIIPTVSREKYLADAIRDILKIEGVDFEIIVIDQTVGGVDPEVRKLHPSIRLFSQREPNASLARNVGLMEARGEIALFIDDDVRIPNRDFLSNHLRHYADPTISGVFGQVLELGEAPTDLPAASAIATDDGWMQLRPSYSLPCRTRNGGSGNLSVRRDWAISVGGMDAWFEKGARREETEFNLRFTRRYGMLVFDPDAGLIHLSAGGGSRTWGRARHTVPMHHVVGHWYFLLRVIVDRTLGLRGIFLELRNIAIALLKRPQVGRNPFVFLNNLMRAVYGLTIALYRVAQGPRRIGTLNSAVYSPMSANRTPV